MDVDEPIQQLLKNTGWSCEELLEKLQIYKSRQEIKTVVARNEDKNEELCSKTKPNENLTNHSAMFDSTGASSTKRENEVLDTANKHNLETEEFSDTDEEDVETNATQSNIIDEIIEDISSTDNFTNQHSIGNQQDKNIEKQEEITEIRVIEVLDDDNSRNETNEDSVKNDSVIVSPQGIEYLETFPRKVPGAKLINISSCSDENNCVDEINTKETYGVEKCNDKKSSFTENLKTFSCISRDNLDISNASDFINDDTTHNKIKMKQDNNSEMDTAMIYKKNCEKVLNSIIGTSNNSDMNKLSLRSELEYQVTSNDQNHDNKGIDFKEESSPADLEDIRNNLKLQLTSLRTRKKGNFLEQLRTKVVDTPACKKKNMNCCNTATKSCNQSKPISIDLKEPEDVDNNELYTQTNELGLVILSVEGGVELEEQITLKEGNGNKNQTVDISNENSSNAMNMELNNSVDTDDFMNDTEKDGTSEVFDEIRKIIQKQKTIYQRREESTYSSMPKKMVSHVQFSFENNNLTPKLDKTCNDVTTIPTENSQSSFTNEQVLDKNSPFVSNTLDEFLTENSKLNISYKVPKCDAEEGLTENYPEETPLMLKKIVDVDVDKVKIQRTKSTEIIKAKTVAQRRKLLEKQRLKEIKKKLKTEKQQASSELNLSDPIVLNQPQKKYSYIQINNKKLWVNAIKPNMCLAKIRNLEEKKLIFSPNHQKKKISLLDEIERKYNQKIKYLPGPLSKKSVLQISDNDCWETKTKLLPKILLEVTPTIGCCFPPSIINRVPQCDGTITADLTEFALSVLKTKRNSDTKNNTFAFPLKYKNNQQYVIVKRKKMNPKPLEQRHNKENNISDAIITSVIDDLIKYVEIKEIAPTLIKEEEIDSNLDTIKLKNMPKIAENTSSIVRKPQKKKSKVELELQRLNCKVVNVEIEENSTEESCNKPYCQLGCVCKSLKCEGIINYHCQNVNCMFGCECPKEKYTEYDKVMLTAGTDILSKDTVTRIEDEAKKDLAKIEREFTQTVIHTNDKTIVVGTGGRYKSRRFSKTPVKYSDYIDINVDFLKESEEDQINEVPDFSQKCFVKLEKLNLRHIIPYCLFHNLYNCHCVVSKSKDNTNHQFKSKHIASKFVVEDKIEEKSNMKTEKKN